jgi:hypothetical protein
MFLQKPLLIPSTLLVSVILTASIVVAPVFAAGPHFIGTPTITKNPDFSLTAEFKASGLTNGAVNITLITFSGGSAKLQCVNPGGDNPPPQEVKFGAISSIYNPALVKGLFSESITLGPPSLPSASQICPDPDWTVTILSLTYNDVLLKIIRNNQDLLTYNFGNVDP